MKSKYLNLVMPVELYDKMQATAKEKNISLAALVRMILSEWLNKQK